MQHLDQGNFCLLICKVMTTMCQVWPSCRLGTLFFHHLETKPSRCGRWPLGNSCFLKIALTLSPLQCVSIIVFNIVPPLQCICFIVPLTVCLFYCLLHCISYYVSYCLLHCFPYSDGDTTKMGYFHPQKLMGSCTVCLFYCLLHCVSLTLWYIGGDWSTYGDFNVQWTRSCGQPCCHVLAQWGSNI